MKEVLVVAEKKDVRNSISDAAMQMILGLLREVYHGEVTLVVQDGYLIQVERSEKLRPAEQERYASYQAAVRNADYTPVSRKIQQEFAGLQFGHIIIVIKKGHIIQVERAEKHRFAEAFGFDGGGI